MTLSRYIMPLLLVLLSGLMYVLYIEKTYESILLARKQNKDFSEAIKNASAVKDLQASLLGEKERIDPNNIERLDKLLPAKHDPVLVIYDLNTFATKQGVVLKAPTVDTPEPKEDGMSHIVIRFTISAPYVIFKEFMKNLEQELAIRDIRGLTITAGSSGGRLSESTVFTYLIEVEGYAYNTKR